MDHDGVLLGNKWPVSLFNNWRQGAHPIRCTQTGGGHDFEEVQSQVPLIRFFIGTWECGALGGPRGRNRWDGWAGWFHYNSRGNIPIFRKSSHTMFSSYSRPGFWYVTLIGISAQSGGNSWATANPLNALHSFLSPMSFQSSCGRWMNWRLLWQGSFLICLPKKDRVVKGNVFKGWLSKN